MTPNGTVISARNLADHIGHRGGRGGVDGELIGSVVFVAEHHGVEARLLQRAQVRAGGFNEAIQTCAGVMQR